MVRLTRLQGMISGQPFQDKDDKDELKTDKVNFQTYISKS